MVKMLIKLTYKAWRSESYQTTLDGEDFEDFITELSEGGPQWFEDELSMRSQIEYAGSSIIEDPNMFPFIVEVSVITTSDQEYEQSLEKYGSNDFVTVIPPLKIALPQ